MRQGSASAYVDGAACSIAGAYAASQSGDTIKVRCSAGTSCLVGGANLSSGTKAVTIAGEPGFAARVGPYDFAADRGRSEALVVSVSNLTVKDLRLDFFEVRAGSGAVFDGIDGESFYITGGSNTMVENGDFSLRLDCRGLGSGQRGHPQVNYMRQSGVSGTEIRNNYFHDNSDVNCASPHVNCFHISSTAGLTFEQNRLFNCNTGNGDSLIVGDNVSQQLANIKIQNNWFGPAANNNNQELNFTSASGLTCTNTVARYNTILSNDVAGGIGWQMTLGCGPIGFYGNILPQLSDFLCNNWGSSDHHNVGMAGTAAASCAASKVVSPSSVALADPANRNYHLGTGSSAVASGDPGNCPSEDVDGDIRAEPVASVCDAGADERA